jgi:catechol 2,3-dioxygenase-like lactoylglutathione lyase family enzyme
MEPFMTLGKLSGMQTHHVALRVPDAEASKAWFLEKLDFRVEGEFEINGMDFVWICPRGQSAPMIELIGGGTLHSRAPQENLSEILAQPGFHHVCLQVDDINLVVNELRRREVKILIDVMDAAPGSGAEKVAFITDPWDNILEFVQLIRK